MKYEDRFDSLIRYHTEKLFPECDWWLIKCQMIQESAANPRAVSPVGALGLMQLMPETARGLGLATNAEIFDCENNLAAGISYLTFQYKMFPEIPDHDESLKFALASYNGGRGYVNKALELAYEYEHDKSMPPGHRGAKPGLWQLWSHSKEKLKNPQCVVRGRWPDWEQMIGYVEKIWGKYREEVNRA